MHLFFSLPPRSTKSNTNMNIATITRTACCRPLEIHVMSSMVTVCKAVLTHDTRGVQLAIAAAVGDLIGRKDGATHAFALRPWQLRQDLRRRQRLLFPTRTQSSEKRITDARDRLLDASSQRQVALESKAHERAEFFFAMTRERLLGRQTRDRRRVRVLGGIHFGLGGSGGLELCCRFRLLASDRYH